MLLSIVEMLQRISHALQFLLPLQSLPMLAANVSGDGIENTLIAIIASDFALLLKLEQEVDCVRLDFLEGQPAKSVG